MAIRRRNNFRFEPTSEGITEQGQIDSLTPDHFDRVFNLSERAPSFLVQKQLMTGDGGREDRMTDTCDAH